MSLAAIVGVADEENLTPEEKVLTKQWRAEMASGLRAVGIDELPWLARYDTYCRSVERKREAHRLALERILQKKRTQLVQALADQKSWSLDDVNRELEALGIPDGFETATPEQVERIWLSYRQARMIVF